MEWEYRVEPIKLRDLKDYQNGLNALGGAGWEMIAIVPNATGLSSSWPVAVFKPPLRAEAKRSDSAMAEAASRG